MTETVLAEGQHQRVTAARMNMAFGQKIRARRRSWGVAPGYGDRRPSANRFSVPTGLPDRVLLAVEVLIRIVRASAIPVYTVHFSIAGTALC